MAIFHLLKHGKPITYFEHMKGMFDFLKVHHTPRKHQTYSSGWEMATTLHNVVLKQIKSLIQQARYISINCDHEVTMLDDQSWIYVHAYVVENWHMVPILFNYERIVVQVHLTTSLMLSYVPLLFLVGCLKLTLLTKMSALGLMV